MHPSRLWKRPTLEKAVSQRQQKVTQGKPSLAMIGSFPRSKANHCRYSQGRPKKVNTVQTLRERDFKGTPLFGRQRETKRKPTGRVPNWALTFEKHSCGYNMQFSQCTRNSLRSLLLVFEMYCVPLRNEPETGCLDQAACWFAPSGLISDVSQELHRSSLAPGNPCSESECQTCSFKYSLECLVKKQQTTTYSAN